MVGEPLIPDVEWPGHQGAPSNPWENKSFERRKTLNGNQEESRQEKETLSERVLVEVPQKPLRRSTSAEAFPLLRRGIRSGESNPSFDIGSRVTEDRCSGGAGRWHVGNVPLCLEIACNCSHPHEGRGNEEDNSFDGYGVVWVTA